MKKNMIRMALVAIAAMLFPLQMNAIPWTPQFQIGNLMYYKIENPNRVTVAAENVALVPEVFELDAEVVNPSNGETYRVIECSSEEGFARCPYLKNLTFPSSITHIGYDCFKECASLETIVFKDGEQEIDIDQAAFYGCTSLKEVYIGGTAKYIRNYAFGNCPSLTKIQLKATTPPSLSRNAFDGVDLSKVTLEVPAESVEAYKSADYWNLFPNIKALPSTNIIYYTSTDGNVIIPRGSDGFGANIVSNTYENGQGKIVFDGDVTKIGANEFQMFRTLQTIVIPNSVTEIRSNAFSECDNLTSIEMSTALTGIGEYAFFDCKSLSDIILPNSIIKIKDSAFERCIALASVKIPDFVTEIGNCAFENCQGLTSLELGSSVTTIGQDAFNCANLTEITSLNIIPPTLDSRSFYTVDKSICLVKVPKTALEVYKKALYWSDFLNIEAIAGELDPDPDPDPNQVILYTSTDGNIVEPNKTDVFGANIVSNTYENGQGKIVFDGNVTKIGEEAFYYNSNLKSIDLPESITEIGKLSFGGCESLSSINIPSSVTKIENSAFVECANLASFTGMFASDDNRCLIVDGTLLAFAPAGLTSYKIPETVTVIGEWVFERIENIATIELPSTLNKIEANAFLKCTGLTSIELPESLAELDERAFYGCSGLTSIVIPSNVTKIGQGAFQNCDGLTLLEIGSSVSEIDHYAFNSCTNLSKITCKATVPPTCGYEVFNYVDVENCKLYVPSGTVESYGAADQWKDFQNILEDPTAIGHINAEAKSGKCFDLNGRRVSDNYKGIVIQDGKKRLNK